MKKSRNILALFLSVLMVLAFAACGGSETAPAASTPSAAPAATAPAESSAPAAATETLKIGLLGHETGWFSVMDLNNIYEAKSYAAVINDEGGVQIGDKKYKIELTVADGKSDNEGIRSGAMMLSDAGIKYVMETNDFWVVGCQDIFEQAGIMHINSYCVGDPDFMGKENPHAFTNANGTLGDYISVFEVLKKYYPNVKTLVFCNDDNGSGDAMQGLLEKLAPNYGISVIKNKVLYSGNTVDVTAIATKLKATGADAFVTSGSMTTIGGIVKELRNAGDDMVAAMAVGQPASSFIKVAGEKAATNAFTLGTSPDAKDNTEIMMKVKARVAKDYGQEVADNWTGNMANGMHQLLYVMKQCGSADVDTVMKAWEGSAQIETIYGMGKTGGTETYGLKNHAVVNPVPVSLIKDGKFEFGGWLEINIP
jgi:branched-chain amino acid transport system substrate-binding protein